MVFVIILTGKLHFSLAEIAVSVKPCFLGDLDLSAVTRKLLNMCNNVFKSNAYFGNI